MGLLASAAVLAPASPASAAITASSSGTAITVTMTGAGEVSFNCSGDKVAINVDVVAPAVACSAVTSFSVTGDGASQSVYGGDISTSVFAAGPTLTVALGDGSDYVYDGPGADSLDLGPGDDGLFLQAVGAANVSASLGAGTGDRLVIDGTPGNDTMTATSSNATVSIAISGATTGTRTVTGAERMDVNGNAGDDTLSTAAVAAASTIDYAILAGGAGNDALTDGPGSSGLYGGAGTNTSTGGAGQDAYWSESSTDALTDASDASVDFVYDAFGLRSGGRTLAGFTSLDVFTSQAHEGDGVARVRPASPAGSALVTLSLTRPGQQLIPPSLGSLSVGQAYVGSLRHVGLVDVVATAKPVNVTLPNTGTGVLDVTIPTGSWSVTGAGTNRTITSTFGTISATNVDEFAVHGPWTNANEGFAHRVTRDLVFRFPTVDARTLVATQLTAGTRTRPQVVAALMDTDEYRGLDVDRVFVEYLRRASDPGGRTYWINSLRNGKALWRFRAQLFGSNEYFTKAGGTNASYVRRAYQDVLGRLPDASGEAFWTNRLNNGADRGSVALQFINSPEARRRLVDEQFLRFLDRLPTTTEQTTWVNQIPTDDGELRLIAFLAGSNAYYTRT
jgi:hypothetical protein